MKSCPSLLAQPCLFILKERLLSTLASVFFCGNLRCLRLHGRVETLSTQLGWETTRFKLVALTSGNSLRPGYPQGHILRHVLALRTPCSRFSLWFCSLLASSGRDRYVLRDPDSNATVPGSEVPLCPPYPLTLPTRTFRAWRSETCQSARFWFPQLPRNSDGLYCSHRPQGLGM